MVLLIFLFYHPAMNTWKRLIDPFKREELRPILAQIQKEKEESDILYVLEPAKYAFRYYHDKFGFEQQDYFIGSKIDRAQDNMQKDLLELRDYQRIWGDYFAICRQVILNMCWGILISKESLSK